MARAVVVALLAAVVTATQDDVTTASTVTPRGTLTIRDQITNMAVALDCNSTVPGDTSDGPNYWNQMALLGLPLSANSNERFYSLTVDTEQSVTFSTCAAGNSLDTVLAILDSDVTQLIAFNNDAGGVAEEHCDPRHYAGSARLAVQLRAGTYIVMVTAVGVTGAYQLSTHCETVPPLADAVSQAPTLDCGTTGHGTTAMGANYLQTQLGSSLDSFWRVVVQERSQVTITSCGESNAIDTVLVLFNPSTNFSTAASAARGAFGINDDHGGSAPEHCSSDADDAYASSLQATLNPGTYVLLVEGTGGDRAGNYSVQSICTAPCASHTSCSASTYCDVNALCYPCAGCATYDDPIDGTCPGRCGDGADDDDEESGDGPDTAPAPEGDCPASHPFLTTPDSVEPGKICWDDAGGRGGGAACSDWCMLAQYEAENPGGHLTNCPGNICAAGPTQSPHTTLPPQCTAHAECGFDQYCGNISARLACATCNRCRLLDDSITGSCADPCNVQTTQPPRTRCSAHGGCPLGEYCDTNSECWTCTWCTRLNDAIDGACPMTTNCAGCSAHSQCDTDTQYCDTAQNCYGCFQNGGCARFNDAITGPGTCPENCAATAQTSVATAAATTVTVVSGESSTSASSTAVAVGGSSTAAASTASSTDVAVGGLSTAAASTASSDGGGGGTASTTTAADAEDSPPTIATSTTVSGTSPSLIVTAETPAGSTTAATTAAMPDLTTVAITANNGTATPAVSTSAVFAAVAPTVTGTDSTTVDLAPSDDRPTVVTEPMVDTTEGGAATGTPATGTPGTSGSSNTSLSGGGGGGRASMKVIMVASIAGAVVVCAGVVSACMLMSNKGTSMGDLDFDRDAGNVGAFENPLYDGVGGDFGSPEPLYGSDDYVPEMEMTPLAASSDA